LENVGGFGIFRRCQILRSKSHGQEGVGDEKKDSGTANSETQPSAAVHRTHFSLDDVNGLMPLLATYGLSEQHREHILSTLNSSGYKAAAPLALLACSAAYHRVVFDKKQKLPDLLAAVKHVKSNQLYIDLCMSRQFFEVAGFVPESPQSVVDVIAQRGEKFNASSDGNVFVFPSDGDLAPNRRQRSRPNWQRWIPQ
jgi:hypothetical protein